MSTLNGTIMLVTPGPTIAVGVVLPALCIVTLALRFYTRRLQKVKLMVDDFVLIPALALIIGMGVSLIIGVQGKALGYPTPFPETEDMEAIVTYHSHQSTLTQKVEFAFELMQVLALGLVKLSILFFYSRIFCTVKGGVFDKVNNTMICIIIAWTVAFFFAHLFSCGTSFYALWGSIEDTLLQCKHTLMMENAFGISDFVLDLIILVLPIPKIWTLHVSMSRKFAVLGVFLLGGVALAASFMRMSSFIIAANAGFVDNVDPDLEITEILYWCMIEAASSLIAANLPTLRFLARKWSFEAFSQCVRNFVSLRSRRSRHVNIEDQDTDSASSHAPLEKPARKGLVEKHAVRDLESQKGRLQGLISVQKDASRVGGAF